MKRLVVPWTPQPRQYDFLQACGLSHPFDDGEPQPPEADVILFGGSAGGGKTDSVLMVGAVAGLTWPGCNVGYFRREYPELEGPGGAIMRSHHLLTPVAKYNGQQRRWKFGNRSILQFCHCGRDQDVHGYQSQQFDVLLIDEASQFTEFQLRYLRTRNRATVKGVIPFTAMASNPGGVGHGTLKAWFIDPGIVGRPFDYEIEPGVTQRHLFIPARLTDNVILTQRDPGYQRRLESQPEEIRRALLDGDWDVFAGQYFKAFRRDKHVITPFAIPDHWMRFASLDWGYAAPHCLLWHAVDPSDMRVYTYREHYASQMRAAEVAQVYLDLTGDEQVKYVKASPDMWQERGLGGRADAGKSIADDFLSKGIKLEPADNRRVNGWSRVREYLADGPDDLPWWQVFEPCANLIRTLPQLIHDTRNVEDVSDQCEDHAPESLRYGLMSVKPPPSGEIIVPGRRPHPKLSPGQAWLEDIGGDDKPRRKRGWM